MVDQINWVQLFGRPIPLIILRFLLLDDQMIDPFYRLIETVTILIVHSIKRSIGSINKPNLMGTPNRKHWLRARIIIDDGG